MRSERSQEGYLYIESRFAPGPSAEYLSKVGKDAPVVAEGATYESATYTCSHCHSVVVLNPNRSRPRNWCSRCAHRVCDAPSCNIDCFPMRALMDAVYAGAIKSEAITDTPSILLTDAPTASPTPTPLITLT